MNPSEPKQLKSVSWKLPHEKPQMKLNIMKDERKTHAKRALGRLKTYIICCHYYYD